MGKYSDAIRESQRQIDEERARSAGITAPPVSPDDMGRAMAKADRNGMPPAVVAENLGQYDEQDHLDQISRVSEDSPALARWLGDPNQSALAKDDVGNLGGISSFMGRGLLPSSLQVPGMALPQTVMAMLAPTPVQDGPQMRAAETPFASELLSRVQQGWYQGKQGLATALPDFGSQRTQDVEETVSRGLGFSSRDEALQVRRAQTVADFGRKAEGASKETPETEAAFQRLAEAESSGSTWNVVKAAVNPRVTMSVVAQSFGATAPNIAMSYAMPASRIMQAGVTGTGSGLAEQGFTILDVMAEQGVDTSDAVSVGNFLRNKEAMAAARDKAATRGVLIGTFDALTAGFAGRLLANSRRGFVSPLVRTVGEGASQAAGGAAGEASAQLATEGRIKSVSDVVLEAVAEVPTALAEGRGQFAEARRNAIHNADKFDAASEQSSVTKLVKLANESKTRTRSASRFESLVQSMTTQGEDTVYISSEAARTLFQSGTDDGPAGPLDGLVSPEELSEAMATGGELTIPLAKYVTFVTPEVHAKVADQIRLQPGTRHDLPAVSSEEIQQAISDGLAEAQQQDQRDNGPAGQVFDDIYGQLLTKQGEKLARQNASIVQSVYRNLAERSGTDAYSLFQQFRINIPGAVRDARGAPRGVDTDVDPLLDALRSGKLPTDEEIVGEGLATALGRAGGLRADDELSAVGAGNRPGLITDAGMSLDDALAWAHQQGFIEEAPPQEDGPDIQTLLDLLGQDLSGNRVGRPASRNVQREKFRAAAQALGEELSQRGIDLSQVDNRRARELLGLTQQTGASTPENDERESLGLPRLYQSATVEESEIEALRRRVAELEAELRTDRLTGLRNQRAFEEDESLGWSTVAAADMDGLKRLNDSIGHEAADQVLRELGAIMLAEEGAGVRFYRRSGDEFAARFRDSADAERVMADLQSRLEEVAIDFDVTGEDGEIRPLTYEGIGLSYGNGQNYAEADAAANRNKADRLAAGIREEARADGQPRRLRPRRDSRWGEGRRAEDQGSAGDVTLNQSERGSVTFRESDGGRQFDIQLLAGADASTFIHETGHVYLEVVNDLAGRDAAPQQLVDDLAKLNEWLGREAGKPITTEQHEQFARGFEQYLREGSAPTSALRRVFAAFKVWLTSIYKSARALNVELTPEVRGVFDRIVASDAEIAEARTEQYQEALITDGVAVGMSPEQFAAYNLAVARAREDAESVVAAELLRAMRIEQQAWYRDERKKVQAEVTQQMRESPPYRAQRLLRTGKLPDGSEAPEALRIKLDKNDLLDHYGQSFLRNLVGTYAVEGGATSDEAASILGFRSGAELVDALVNAPPINEAIKAETDSRMADRHPDPMTDGTLPDRAMVAAHRDRQAEVMVREIRALEGREGARPVTDAAVVKGIAKAIIAEKKLRNLQPASYRAAEAKAGREAFEAAAKQDWDVAIAARRRQLLNFELFREAVRARNEATATANYLAKFGQTKVRARLGKSRSDYLEQIDSLLDRFDFRKLTNKTADRRASLAAWIKKQSDEGREIDIPDKLLDEAFRVPFKELTMAELRQVRDAVKAIDHMARLKGKLLLGKEVRDAAEIDGKMAASVREGTVEQRVTTGDRTNGQKIRQAFQQGRVLQATATDLARELDGFTNGGAVWANTVGVIRNAVNNEVNPRLKQAQTELSETYLKHYTKDEIRDFGRKVPMPEANGDLWSKRRLLALALNWGNQGNREAILSQSSWRTDRTGTPEMQSARIKAQVDTLLGRLDARDWAFVQDVWKQIDSYWPDISEAQKRRTGLSPEKVENSPFVVRTSDGQTLTIPGGYYPLKYEADSIRTMKDESEDFYNSIRTGRSAKASTKNGHTIERVGSGGRTVLLDTGVIQQHLRDVIRDLHLGDAVNYVNEVLTGSEFRQAIDVTGQQEYAKALELWLKDVAAGEIGPRVWHERAMRAVRTNFTASVLAFKPVSAALQITGLIQSSVVLGQSDTWQAVGQFLQKPIAMTKYVRDSSPYMASRMDTHVEAIQAVMDAEAGRFRAGRAAAIRFGYWMMGRVQQQVDVATWLAAENQGMRLFKNDVVKARQYADDAISRAQSSGEFIDKNPLQRGSLGDSVRQSELIKAVTVLQSYLYAKGNAAYEITRKTNFKSPTQTARWAANMVMLFTVEAIVVAAIRGKLPSDEDDDGVEEEIGGFLAKETFGNLFGSIPGGGLAVTELRGYDAKGIMASAWEAVADTWTQVEQGEMDRGVTKAAVTVSGYAMGLPSAQINKTIDAVSASADGEDVSPYEYLTGPTKDKP